MANSRTEQISRLKRSIILASKLMKKRLRSKPLSTSPISLRALVCHEYINSFYQNGFSLSRSKLSIALPTGWPPKNSSDDKAIYTHTSKCLQNLRRNFLENVFTPVFTPNARKSTTCKTKLG